MAKIIIPTPQEKKPMAPAYQMLANVVRSYEPDRLCEDTIKSFRFMLKSEVFAPIHSVIEDKILEVAEFFRKRNDEIIQTNLEGKPLNKPKRPTDTRKKKRKAANAGDVPEGSTPGPTMEFTIRGGILVPNK